MTYQQGDIVFVNFPFDDDALASKQRPAIVVSKVRSRIGAYIIAKITSVSRNDEHSFWLSDVLLSRPMPRLSQVRTNEIQTLSESQILHKFSSLNRLALKELCQQIQLNFEVK